MLLSLLTFDLMPAQKKKSKKRGKPRNPGPAAKLRKDIATKRKELRKSLKYHNGQKRRLERELKSLTGLRVIKKK